MSALRLRLRLREPFLSPYRRRGDPFESLLARSTYLAHYCRGGETWTDTIRRVVEGNCSECAVDEREAEELFHLFWTMQALPPGRGLWVGGVEGIPAEARKNCWYTTLYDLDDWCWTADKLMLGGGVGVGLQRIDSLPVVARGRPELRVYCSPEHPNAKEVQADEGSWTPYLVPDTRTGWIESLRDALYGAFSGRSVALDVSRIRPRGTPLKTFGGIACGPGPLTSLLRSAWQIVRGAEGRRLTSVEALDVTNLIGLCVKSGNVRRSALIVLGDADDHAFRDAKKDLSKVLAYRSTSNNSIAVRSREALERLDWNALAEDCAEFGEPGVVNMPLAWETDPHTTGVNPCSEIFLTDRESCNLAEVFPARFARGTAPGLVFRLVVRYCLRQRLAPFSDPRSDKARRKYMRLGVGLGGCCDFDWDAELLGAWYRACREEADRYAAELGVNRPVTVTTVKPSGTISLLCGSSPGMHAPYAPYYVRRARLAKNDPMADALAEAGVPREPDAYDQTGRTWVYAFPTAAPPGARLTGDRETAREQFERQRTLQEHWADNSVSATVSFSREEHRELGALLREHGPHLKSTSCLPRAHGYPQAPYEAISREEYVRLRSAIDEAHPLARGSLEVEECAGGACPSR